MVALLTLISNAVNLYINVLLVAVVLSWLIAFDVVNPYSRLVRFALFAFIVALIAQALNLALNLYMLVPLVAAALSWLIAPHNNVVAMINDMAQRLTEPALRPFRRFMQRRVPSLQVDVSPIILILLLNFVVNLMWELYGSVAH